MAVVGKKTKIVLDADVIIHFAKGGRLDMLPRILPEFQFMVLDVVKKEIPLLLMPLLQKVIEKGGRFRYICLYEDSLTCFFRTSMGSFS